MYPQQGVMVLTQEPSWMGLIVTYPKTGEQPKDQTEALILQLKAARYVVYDNKLYKRGYYIPLLKCVTLSKEKYIMREIHEGICGNHDVGQSLLAKQEDGLHGIRPQI